MKLTRSMLLALMVCAATMVVAACGPAGENGGAENAQSEDYPNQDITLVVQAAAGGTSDLTSRTAAKIAEKELGVDIIVENRPGAAGSTAFQYVANQPPDGYTVAHTSVEIAMVEHLGYGVSPEDFEFVAQLNQLPATVVVREDSPYETFDDLIAAAKENPGQISMGNSGPGSVYHVATAAIEQETGAKFNPVPFDGAAPEVPALLGGEIDAAIVGVLEAKPNIDSGKFRGLAVLGEERDPQIRDVPTAKELGYDVVMMAWGGIGAPAGTPQNVIDTLAEAFQKAVETEEFQKTMRNAGNQPLYRGPEEFTGYVQSQSELYGNIIPKMELQ
jgi:tripartite-type tricarboxylate transporter receptor subunit TctC